MAGCYPCVQCKKRCRNNTIQCCNCNRWVHVHCVPMSSSQLKMWSQPLLSFLCRDCCFTDNEYDFSKALERISSALHSDPKDLKMTVSSESLLLETYGVKIPKQTNPSDQTVDEVSRDILKQFHPAILSAVFPAKTVGDGNCMYRAVSRAMTGSESHHVHFRLLTAIEILQNKYYYDPDHRKFVDLVNDNRIVCSPYSESLQDAVSLYAFSSMTHIFALSAALRQPIRSYYPPQLSAEFVSEPHSRKVIGRGVKMSESPTITIMWTQMRSLSHKVSFSPNHFVPLINVHAASEQDVVNCDVSMLSEITSDCEVEVSKIQCESVSDTSSAKNTPITHVEERKIDYNQSKCDILSETVSESDNNISVVQESCEMDINSESGASETIHAPFIANESVHDLANGCLDRAFLDVNDLVTLLQSFSFTESHASIPTGLKNDVYFVVQNSHNLGKRTKGQRSSFSDDCGVWNSSSGSTPKTCFIRTESGDLKNVFLKNGAYCTQKKEKGKRVYVPLEPQPENSVIELYRHYTTLKQDSSYKKRVSWLASDNEEQIALVEYLGHFPGLASHGNSKQKTEYMRTPATVMQEMSNLLSSKRPGDVYNVLTAKYDELQGPTSKKQIYDKNRNDKKKVRSDQGHFLRRGNIADHVSEIDKLVAKGGSIVQSIIRDQGKAPCLILYNEDQMTDIKNLCCTGQSPLGIDKTFNLCDMHVTATCYRQSSVVMESTGEPPIFLGPLYIHDNSDFETYSNFFNHMRTKLSDSDTTKLVFGSDEEKALVNAITTAFPNSQHMLCKRHLYQNTKQKLVDDCVDKSDRREILDLIYGDDGLITADDTICFEAKCEHIEDVSRELSGKFLKYFQNKLKSNLKEKVNKPMASGFVDSPWTNNNSESLNHILKQAINWKSQPLLDLTITLTGLIDTQFKDLKKALVGTGQYRLADTHRHFEVSKSVWVSKTTDERNRHYKKFRNFKATEKTTVTSTDGKMTIVKPKSLGKKLGQRKRKINERTTTIKKGKM